MRGLMLDGKRKSMQPMAERRGVDHQQLQQLISSSTWEYVEVRRRVGLVRRHGASDLPPWPRVTAQAVQRSTWSSRVRLRA